MKRSLALFFGFFTAGFLLVSLLGALGAPRQAAPRTESRPDAWAALAESEPEDACARCRNATRKSSRSAVELRTTMVSRREAPSAPEGVAAREAASLTLDLRCAGRPWPLDVELSLASESCRLERVWTPERRRFELEPGRYRVALRSGGLTAKSIEVELGLGHAARRVVNIEASLGGRLEAPEAYCPEVILIAAPLELWDPSCSTPHARGYVLTRAKASYAFPPLAPGTYQIAFSPDGHCVEPLAIVELTEGAFRELDLKLPEVEEDRRIALEVLGLPTGSASVHWSVETEGGGGYPFRIIGGGRALVLICRALNPDMRLWLKGWHERRGSVALAFTPRDRKLVLRFPEPAELLVDVSALRGAGPRAKLRVSWSGWDQASNQAEEFADESGVAVLTNIAPGPGQLSVLNTNAVLVTRFIEVRPGQQSLSIEAPRLGRLEVLAPDHAGRWVSINDGSVASETISAEGRAVFEALPFGRYEVSVGDLRRWVTVPGGPLMLRRGETRSWRVRIDDPRGALARIGLEHDDQILAIDGRPITDETDLYELRGHKLRLKRGGVIVDLPIPLRLLRDASFLRGGSLERWREE